MVVRMGEMVLVGPPIVFPSAALQNYKNNREKGGARWEGGRERRTPQREAEMYLPQAAAKCVEFGEETHLTACPHPSINLDIYIYIYILAYCVYI